VQKLPCVSRLPHPHDCWLLPVACRHRAGGDKTARAEYDFYAPASRTFLTKPLTESTIFDGFEIQKAGEYCLEFFIRGLNYLERSYLFTVQPAMLTSMKIDLPTKTPALQLGDVSHTDTRASSYMPCPRSVLNSVAMLAAYVSLL
jgi:hypothetical protein